MADYYSILNNTIGKLANNNADNRAVVYGKARAAIDRQLRAMNPVPSEEAIARQMELLEESIGKVEAEQEALSQAAEVFSPEPPVEPEPGPTPEPEPSSPQQDVIAPQAQDVAAPPAPASQHDDRGALETAGAIKTGDAGVEASPVTSSEPSSASVDHGVYSDPGQVSEHEADLVPDRPLAGDVPRKKGFLGRLMPYVLGLAVIGAGGYALWLNKDALMEAINQPTAEVSQSGEAAGTAAEGVTEDAAEENASAEDAAQEAAENAEKENARLGSDGSTQEAPPVESEATSEPTNGGTDETPIVLDQQTPPATSEPVEVEEVGEGTEAGAAEGTQDGDAAADATATESGAAAQDGSPIVAEKAFLYTEGTGGQGAQVSNASVVWTLGSEPAVDGAPDEAIILGEMDVPDLGLVMNMKIKRNADPGLPASHLIELAFSVPPDFPGGNVDNVARFVMKSSEQARGEGLIAVPARIDAGFFLIALNNLDQAVATNRKLLMESGWIDIPLAYATGIRALVTLEKGDAGDEVFRQAFADWDTR